MATSVGDLMTAALTAQLLALADGPAVRGIAVLGSVARGDASSWSDVDVELDRDGDLARLQAARRTIGIVP